MNKSFAKVLAVIVVLSGMVFGQAASQHCDVATTTVNSLLKVLPRATIRVCRDQSTPANPNLACSPLINTYTDELATTLAPNPVTADALGNFCYFAAKGRLTQQVCASSGGSCTVRTGMYITTGSASTSPNQIGAVPLCQGFAPLNGQALQYTTSQTPNPCYTTVATSTIRFATNEIPVGLIDGANTVFTLANTPVTGTLMLFRNGVLQIIGTNYTLATNTITFISTSQPNSSDSLTALYQY